MKTLADPADALARGLADIRREFDVPRAFPQTVLVAANEAAARRPTDHVDRTDRAFVTLDPATSTDLDQAFAIERAGADLLLHYAIADVAWFVRDGGALDAEAWARGETLYLPDGRAGLYPPVLGEAAASLLPDGPRPAVIFTVRVAPDGGVVLDDAERALIRNRAKLAYGSVRDADLPEGFAELTDRVAAAECARGASRIDPPEQEVASSGDGSYRLVFRPRLESESRNAALSLATNMAIAATLQAHGTGLFRVMPAPDASDVERLRHTARGLGLAWPAPASLAEFERTLAAARPAEAAFMLAARRAGGGAAYAPYQAGTVPWHGAMAATYAHATAPLRRLADRYVIRATLAVANGEPVPPSVTEAFEKLPKVMARADARANRIDRAVIDLAEAVMLAGKEGTTYPATVTATDDRGAAIQLRDLPITARVSADDVAPGETIRVKLVEANAEERRIGFAAID